MLSLLLFLSASSFLFGKGSAEFKSYQAKIAVSELFFDLSLYDNYRSSAYDSTANFEDGSYGIVIAKGEHVIEGKYLWRRPSRTFNKCLPYEFSVPETFAFIAAAATKETLPEGQKFIPLPEAPPVPSTP